MSDVNIKIGTHGDVTGLKQIEAGYQNLINKAKQAYQGMRDNSPMQLSADRQLHERKMAELARKAADIDRKVMSIKLGMAEGGIDKAAGATQISQLNLESLRAQYERSMVGDQLGNVAQRQARNAHLIAPINAARRFTTGKVMKYGAAGAGLMGAYSLFSNIAGQLGEADNQHLAYAEALSSARNRHGNDYEDRKGFYDIQAVLKNLGETAYITAKDMVPMLEAAKELGDLSGGKGSTGGKLGHLANIGKSLGVDPALISEMIKTMLQKGQVTGLDQYTSMAKMMMLNGNMMHRATESLQSLQQVASSANHGTSGLGAFGMFNLLDTMNSSRFLNYRGSGGANALINIDSAFRGGGNENFQYFQTMALHPAFQKRNAARLKAWQGTSESGSNFGSGQYDQIISDVFKELGAYATPADVAKQLTDMGFQGAADHVKNSYGDSGKMNIERVMDQYRSAYGSKNEGRRLFMTAQLSKDLGVGFADVGVLDAALKDKKFMERAKSGNLSNAELVQAKKAWDDGKGKGYDDWMKTKKENENALLNMAKGIKDSVDLLKKELNTILVPMGESIKKYLPEIVDTILRWVDPEAWRDKQYQKNLLGMGINVDSPDYVLLPKPTPEENLKLLGITTNYGSGGNLKDYETKMEDLPKWATDPGNKFRQYDQITTGIMRMLMPNMIGDGPSSGYKTLTEAIGNSIIEGIKTVAPLLGEYISNGAEKGISGTVLGGPGAVPID